MTTFHFKSSRILILCLFSSVFIASFTFSEEVVEQKYEFASDPKVQQKISILVGSAKAGEDLTDGSEDTPNGEAPSLSTSSEDCATARCCYQYTWQGYIQEEEIPKSPANATCDVLRAQKKDDSIACFDPIVYTTGTSGNSPDIESLSNLAKANKYRIFCPLTGTKSCMSIRYFSRGGGGNKIVNETRFCGSVTDITSGKSVTSGCYKEKTSGYTREVCVCNDKTYCNSSQRIGTSLAAVLIGFLIVFILPSSS